MADSKITLIDPPTQNPIPVKYHDNADGTFSMVTYAGTSTGTIGVLGAGEAHIGEVGAATTVVAPAITVTNGAYHANDNVGGVLTLTGASRVSGKATTLTRVSVLDAANQKKQLELVFFNANPSASTFTDNAAPVIHANDQAKFVGRITINSSDYISVGTTGLACLANIGLAMVPNGSANLYCVILTPDTPTYTTGCLQISLAFYQD